MPLPANSLEQLFAFEENLESGFVQMLKAAGINNCASSRSGEPMITPFVSLWFQNGEPIKDWQKPIIIPYVPGAYLPDTAYTGTLTTELVTNRGDDLREREHYILLAQMRKNLQLFRLVSRWRKFQEISLIFGIKEGGTVDTIYDQEKNLDSSTITWNIRHCINPQAWPANIDL